MGRKRPANKDQHRTPADPQELFQRAVAAYEAGRYRQAQKALSPLIELPDPQGFVTLLNGLVHVALGEWKAGEKWLSAALRIQPSRVEGWMGLGNAQRMQAKAESAVASFRRALELQPHNVEIMNNLGIAYADMRRDHDAIKAFREAVHQQPGMDRAKRGLAEALVRVGRFEEASATYRELLEDSPDDPGLQIDYAELLEQANRVDESRDALPDISVLKSPDHIARREALRARLMARDGQVEDAIEVLARAQRRTGQDWLGYVEGSLHDRLGDPDRAMKCFQRANTWRGRQTHFRRLREQGLVSYLEHKVETGIRRDPDNAVSGADAPVREPVFIIGLPRSGTTLLDRMLAAHPQVQVLEEPESLRIAESVIAAGGSIEDARARYWAFLEETVGLDPEAVIVDKNPLHALHLDLLPSLFPGARTIYALRHPYDAALSSYMQDFFPNPASAHFVDLESTARLCAGLLDMMRLFEEAWPERVHRVRYEDLVTGNLRARLEPLLDGIGLSWHDDIEQFSEKASQSGLIRTASYEQVTRGLYTSAVERWHGYRSALQPFFERLGPRLEYWGYEG